MISEGTDWVASVVDLPLEPHVLHFMTLYKDALQIRISGEMCPEG